MVTLGSSALSGWTGLTELEEYRSKLFIEMQQVQG